MKRKVMAKKLAQQAAPGPKDHDMNRTAVERLFDEVLHDWEG
jgi:hypothetical protein